MCKGGEKKKPGRFGKGKNPNYDRSERMAKLGRRVDKLGKNFS